jgi:hypothetical protein
VFGVFTRESANVKHWTGGLLVVAVTVLQGLVAQGAIYTDYTWKTYNGHEYAVTLTWNTWLNAEAEAEAVGGHLAAITSEEERDFLIGSFPNYYARGADPITPEWGYAYAWIGLLRDNSSSSWKWVDGEAVGYMASMWGGGPNPGNHAYMLLSPHIGAGAWDFYSENDTVYANNPLGIIERDRIGPDNAAPEPCTLAIWSCLGVCGIGIGWRRRRSAA